MRHLACCLLIAASPAFAQDVGDGSISGDLNTNIGSGSTVDSNNASESVTNNFNSGPPGAMSNPVPTASAPTVMGGGGNQSCLIPSSTGFQVSLFGIARGEMIQDEECNRRRDAVIMATPNTSGGMGLQVSGIAVMCDDNPRVFRSMALAGTPCPIYSISERKLLLGFDAYAMMRANPETYIPGYAADRGFWDELLMIGEELPAYEPPENNSASLSDRFRRNSGTNDGRSSIRSGGD